jgi:hypothetical protein
VETEFSFRTRVLDYFWAGLPVVATSGDSLSEIVGSRGAGFTVPPGDVDALEEALFQILDDEDLQASCTAACKELAEEFRWSTVLRPLVEFCRAPRRAPDLVDPLMATTITDPFRVRRLRRRLQRDLGIVSDHLREGDVRTLALRIRRRMLSVLGRKAGSR